MRRSAVGILVVVALALTPAAACGGGGSGGGGDERPDGGAGSTTSTSAPGPTAAALCAGARPVRPPGRVAQSALTEASGLVASLTNDGILWSHNDSGGAPEVFAMDGDGGDRGRWVLAGAQAVDWEDIARAPGAGGHGDVLYLGDIGDNNAQRPSITVYRAPEPTVGPGTTGGTVADVEALHLTYADGPHNAETLLADPVTGDLFIVTKVFDGTAGAYRISAGVAAGASVTITRAGHVAVRAGQLITGGDVSPDGSLVALRTYTSVLVWDRAKGQSVAEALAKPPCSAPAPTEPQGEALAFEPDGRGYITVSEGANPALNRFRLR